MLPSEPIEGIIRLRGPYEQVLFKKFFSREAVAENLNSSHIITIISLTICGPQRMSEISEQINLEKGSFTPVAKRLVDLGYVERLPDPADRRASILSLTERGQRFGNKLKNRHLAYIEKLLDVLNDDERSSFFQSIDTLTVIMGKLGKY